MDGNMYSPYQNNIYDLDNINVQDVDFSVGYDSYSANYNFGEFVQDGLGSLDQRAPMKLKIDAANTRDLTSLQWLQSVSLPVDQNGSRQVQLMVDPNTNMPVQFSRANQVVSLQQQVGIPQIQQIFSRSDIQEMASIPPSLASKVQVKPGKENGNPDQKIYPKPVFSYSCLIAMALKNSETGSLPVSEIYKFMQGKFPYFKTAPDGWKNSVRHNLSLNKAFCKLERPDGTSQRKGCLWSLKPEKQEALEREIRKWKKKHPDAIKAAMANPDELNVSSDSMDDSMDDHSNTPEHTVPEVGVVKSEPVESTPTQGDGQGQQHFQSQQDDMVDAATADAAKDLFGNDIFQDMQAEDFWTDLLATSTSEPHLNFFDNVSDSRMLHTDLNGMELENSVKLNGSQNYFQSPSHTQQPLAGM